MKAKLLVVAALACAAITALAALAFDLPWDRAAVLAPVIVAAVGAGVMVLALWTRIALQSLRNQRHPRLIVALALAVLGAMVVLSFFVGPLPRE